MYSFDMFRFGYLMILIPLLKFQEYMKLVCLWLYYKSETQFSQRNTWERDIDNLSTGQNTDRIFLNRYVIFLDF